MSRFPSAEHLWSWGAMCPGQNESAGKGRSGKTRQGNRYLRGILVQAGLAATRAIFMNILEFRARVFVMSGGHSDYGRAALSPETTLPVRLRRPRKMRVPGCPSKPTGPPGPVDGCR